MSGKGELVEGAPPDGAKPVGPAAPSTKVRRRAPVRQAAPARPAKPPKPPAPAPTAMAKRVDVTPEMSLFERIAANPEISVEKLDALISAQERIKKINAEQAFNEAFAKMQAGLPVVVKRGRILVEEKLRSKYARYEDIVEKIRPVLSEHGFSIRHETKQLEGGLIEITGVLAHRDGHSVKDVFTTRPDSGGKMNDIQRIGSAISYGKRYTLSSLVGIATAGEDDDGNATGKRQTSKEAAAAAKTPTAGSDGKGEEVITDKQRQRMWVIIKRVGRTDHEIKMWLTVKYKITSSKLIPRRLYDEICKAIEANGPLPLPDDAPAREPGSDDL